VSALLLAALLSVANVRAPAPGVVEAQPSKPAARASFPAGVDSPEAKSAKAKALIATWRGDPVRFVRDQFKAEPDEWQKDALVAVSTDFKVAMSACKGPGKSCLLAWVMWWFLATHPHAQIMAVSITADNLRDNLWKELAVWQSKSELLKEVFEWGAERIVSRKYPATWWASARAFSKSATPEQQAATLAGFHGQNIMVVLDEIGDYPPGVLPAAEAIFANEDIGGAKRLVVAGNPTSPKGPLYGIVTRPDGWTVIRITGDPDDPKRSPRISLAWARAEIARWGRDNPYIKVNILGEFPPAGADQLISIDDVMKAMDRDVPALSYRSDPIIWGLDPSRSARAGADEAALARRQGVLMRKFHTWRGLDGPQLAAAVAKLLLDAEDKDQFPDAIFVDVGGVGASCYDHLCLLGYEDLVFPVDFGGSASDDRFHNKRSEMWWSLAEWVHASTSCLPKDPALQEELVAPNYGYRVVNKRTALILESKEDMKKRGVRSPNRADAAALTFAEPVARRGRHDRLRDLVNSRGERCKTDYDPLGSV
jgi:hypothetical protein